MGEGEGGLRQTDRQTETERRNHEQNINQERLTKVSETKRQTEMKPREWWASRGKT